MLAAAAAAAVVGCGGGGGGMGSDRGAGPPQVPTPQPFPQPGTRTIAQLRAGLGPGPRLATSVSVLEPGRDRVAFALFDRSRQQIADTPTALKTIFGRMDDWLQAEQEIARRLPGVADV